jgi:hypothetical protein
MLHAKSITHILWDEALNCVNYIHNISPNRSIKDKTPFEAWNGLKPEVTEFHIFGSRAWASVGPRPSFEETLVRFYPLLDFDTLFEEGEPRWS